MKAIHKKPGYMARNRPDSGHPSKQNFTRAIDDAIVLDIARHLRVDVSVNDLSRHKSDDRRPPADGASQGTDRQIASIHE